MNTDAHAALNAAEQLFALRGVHSLSSDERRALWAERRILFFFRHLGARRRASADPMVPKGTSRRGVSDAPLGIPRGPSVFAVGMLRRRRKNAPVELEAARRNAAIVQHHDAITGTMCKASEGCAGTDP